MPDAAFVGEGSPISVSQGTSSVNAVLTPYKLATLIALTGEMMRNSNAEQLIRAALVAAVGPSLDAAMLNANPGSAGVSPPGILNGVTAITSTPGGGLNALVGDVRALAGALKTVAGNGGVVLLAAVEQSVSLALLPPGGSPYPVFASSALAAGTLVAIATQALATAVDAPSIEAASDTTIQLQTPPTGDLMAGSPVRNVFQTDSVSLRFRLPCSWALRSPTAVAWLTNATW
jgi:hypothetical protein